MDALTIAPNGSNEESAHTQTRKRNVSSHACGSSHTHRRTLSLGEVRSGWAAAVPPPSDRGAPASPGGGRRPRPPPRAASPTQSRATRVGPIQTRGQRTVRRQRRGASPQKPRMHAGEIGPRRTPICPRGQDGRTHATPIDSSAALRRARPPPSDLGRAPLHALTLADRRPLKGSISSGVQLLLLYIVQSRAETPH